MAKIDQRIESLEEKLKQLKTRQLRAATRTRALLSKRERRDATRRRVLVGAVILAKVEAKEFDEALFRKWMSDALEREDDRVLFGLSHLSLHE
jgi:hypothetical protein